MHLLGLINQVLDMAKIESGQTVAEMSAVDLPMLVDDVDAMMRTRAESAGLQFVVEVADDVPRYIRSDGQKLRQILLNLVGNSLKFTTEEVSARVKTSGDTGSSTHAGLRLVIEVEDSGPGSRRPNSSGFSSLSSNSMNAAVPAPDWSFHCPGVRATSRRHRRGAQRGGSGSLFRLTCRWRWRRPRRSRPSTSPGTWWGWPQASRTGGSWSSRTIRSTASCWGSARGRGFHGGLRRERCRMPQGFR